MANVKFCPPPIEETDNNLLRPCFQVGGDVELKENPASGEEYLLKVINERRNLIKITKCDIDISKYRNRQSRFVQQTKVIAVDEKLKPTIEWQNIQVADFSDVRMYISKVRANINKIGDDIEILNITNDTLECWKTFFSKKEPKLTCVLGFDQSQLDRGLERLIQVLKETKPGETIDHKTGQWIYAFLACLKLPLLADSLSILRALARKCASLRSKIDPEQEDATQLAAPYSLFICLVAKYFGQGDLADQNCSDNPILT